MTLAEYFEVFLNQNFATQWACVDNEEEHEVNEVLPTRNEMSNDFTQISKATLTSGTRARMRDISQFRRVRPNESNGDE